MLSEDFRIEFDPEYEEDIKAEMTDRGFCANVIVTIANGNSYRVNFYDPARVELETKIAGFIVEPSLIIVSKVTVENLNSVIREMIRVDYFDGLIPLDKNK